MKITDSLIQEINSGIILRLKHSLKNKEYIVFQTKSKDNPGKKCVFQGLIVEKETSFGVQIRLILGYSETNEIIKKDLFHILLVPKFHFGTEPQIPK